MARIPNRREHSQQLSREINDRIRELWIRQSEVPWTRRTEFMCECGDPFCLEELEMTLDEYPCVRADPRLRAVAVAHEFRSGEVFARAEHVNLVLARAGPVVERLPVQEPTDPPPAAA